MTAASEGTAEVGVPAVAPSPETWAGRPGRQDQRTGGRWGVVVGALTGGIGEEVEVEEEAEEEEVVVEVEEEAEEKENSGEQELDDDELPGKLCAT